MKKIKLLEYIILTTIFISLIVIIIFTISILNDKTETSNSNETQNYSITKITKYEKNPHQSSNYKIPLQEYIDYETSIYNNYIISTDNIITNLVETIYINYTNIPNESKNEILNYCNEYDNIENNYKLQCRFKDNNLIIKNNFDVNTITTDSIKTKHLEIFIPIKNNTKLNNYLEELTNQNIHYTYVDKIE